MQEYSSLYQSGTESKTIFDRTLSYMETKYDLRFNVISLEYQIRLAKSSEEWSDLNINSLYIELIQSGIDISMNKLEILIKSHLIQWYNPIEEYFSTLDTWDGQDYIGKLCSYIKTADNISFNYHFEKWFTRAVLCALENGYVNKQCMVLASSEQNTGKTSFLRFLIPPVLRSYYTENISVDKDGIIAICKNLICNADELAVLSKTDVNMLKAYISKSNINVRLPYGRKAEYMERICSFVGSTNRTDFLTDESGSVRWLVFEIQSIDFKYREDIDIDKVWSQAYYYAYKKENYNPELSFQDILENEKRNEKFTQISTEQEVLLKYFEKSDNTDDFLTATDIMLAMNEALSLRLNNIRIGKALTYLKYQRIKHPKLQIYGYLIKRKV
ncbi:VapE domain-containing protein [Elizabethkingia anophelis]|uniref:Predicted P-loop ATPase and inactivated derivatives n=1 Tax=Elizabethkingia anophelis TaxID=1117645 RepID=A0A7Z7LZX5_9FLAO|nr:VapE domain-containing protein [Elizabethkingia anophelis]STF08901.1 Predicted P-loop ATPase and inactivated derivatives [Elizabethkingia anophelis]